jgi:hypothetical protein
MPLVRDNFERIQKEYDGKVQQFRILHPKNADLESRLRAGFGKIKGEIKDKKSLDDNFDIVTLEMGPIRITKPEHYFETADIWSVPHNGFGYVQQMLRDTEKGLFGDLTIEQLFEYGKQIKLSPGIVGLIPALKDKWKDKCDLEAYIISVGIFEIIAGSAIAPEFDGIFATPLTVLGDGGMVNCASDIVTPFNKSKSVIQIAKGSIENLNKRMKSKDYAIDYRNIISFGDGLSDVSQFAYLRKKGAEIICVYTAGDDAAFKRAFNNQILRERVNYLLPRDYRVNGPTWAVINERIDRILNRKCNLSPTLIDLHRKGRIGDSVVDNSIGEHIAECPECKTAISFNWVDTMRSAP